MAIVIKTIALTIVFTSVQSLEPIQEQKDVLTKIIELLYTRRAPQRRANLESLNKAKNLYTELTKNMNKKQIKKMLREGQKKSNGAFRVDVDPFDKLAEDELIHSLTHKKSALLDHPHVESQGRYDFLVLEPEIKDSFVTVIPNAMYQKVEKKCVNWLDDCSLKGIRSRLLRGMRSPYR